VSHASHCEVPCQRQVLDVHASNTLAQRSGAVDAVDTGKNLQERHCPRQKWCRMGFMAMMGTDAPQGAGSCP